MTGTPHLRPPRPGLLIVDDDPFVVAPLKLILSSLGYKVATAENAVRGLACAVKYRPQIILLDLSMPEVDGFDFLQHRRKLSEIEETPVIVLTARHARDDVNKAVELGARDYLVKPVDETVLAHRVGRIVPSPLYTPAIDSTVDWGVEAAKSLL